MIFRSVFLGLFATVFGAVAAFGFLFTSNPKVLALRDLEKVENGDPRGLIESGPIPVFILPVRDLSSGEIDAKRERVVAGRPGTIRLTEGELNAWLLNHFSPAGAERSGRPIELRPELPRVSLYGDSLQFAGFFGLKAFGKNFRVAVVGTGYFLGNGDGVEFRCDSLSIAQGRIPVGRNLVLGLLRKPFEAAPEFEEWQAMAGKMRSAEVVDGALEITL